jgi:Amt family ammonium transporter
LLLIKVDKYPQLTSRFGEEAARKFVKTMASIVVRAQRDSDVICSYSSDTLAVLMPNVDEELGRRRAQVIRDSVCSYHFRLDESGPEVLVTASFGATCCLPHDNFDLTLNRAGNALARSQRKGRNQLHVHDGNVLSHCSVG